MMPEPHRDEPDEPLANVFKLPVADAGEHGGELATTGDTQAPAIRQTGDIEPGGPVLEGELLTDEQSAALDRRMADRARAAGHGVVRVVRVAATHQHTRTGARHAVVVLVATGQGVQVWTQSAWDWATMGVYRRQIRAAEAMGDQLAVAEWVDRQQTAIERRRRRIVELPTAALSVVKTAGLGLAGVSGATLVVAVAAQVSGAAGFLDVLGGALDAARFGLLATGWAIQIGAWAAPFAAAVAAYRTGKAKASAPRWLTRALGGRDVDTPITPSIVVAAFRDLGIAELRKAIKDMGDAGSAMLGPIVLAGRGVEVDVTLPRGGVSVDEVIARRAKLAGNLDRLEHEVFPTKPPAARTVRLWIADSGALDEPIGPSPLVIDTTMTADLYTGKAPWGEDLRGDQVALPLLQRHLLLTGLSNQGKTAALRALALWLALDRTVEFRIADLKGIGDWHMFAGLASELHEGPTDDHVIDATQMLEAGVAEMERRLSAVDPETHKNGVTRELAVKPGSGFHPIVLIVDEAQVAFMCPAVDEDKKPYGGQKSTSRYFLAARKIHNQGRAVNVVLWQGTQNPTDQNLPKLVREGAHIRGALVLGTEAESRMAVGDKAVNGGAAPHMLRQGLDKGTLVVAGDGVPLPPGQASITVRTHFIDGEAADEIATRAKALRGGLVGCVREAVTERDLVADLAQVLTVDELPVADCPALLANAFPDWAPYALLNGVALRAQLAALGVKVPSTNRMFPVRRKTLLEALAARELAAGDGAGESAQ